MRFVKMQGLGNDFVVLDGFSLQLPEERLPDLARRMCDRHYGIGADGVLIALPSDVADFRMRLINADGSEAEHCGNGIRCVARYVREAGHVSTDELAGETVGRVNRLQLRSRDGAASSVRVDMGRPSFRRGDLPMVGAPDAEAIEEPLQVNGTALRVTCVSMGNPHAVAFVDDVDAFPVAEIGPRVERHPSFPRRTNVEFIQVLGPSELTMRVWERGAGETLACGTGACASVVAAGRTGRAGRSAVVHLLGGDLEIEWAADERVYMTGPAETVFTGDWLAD